MTAGTYTCGRSLIMRDAVKAFGVWRVDRGKVPRYASRTNSIVREAKV
jgi:hypothetical protein